MRVNHSLSQCIEIYLVLKKTFDNRIKSLLLKSSLRVICRVHNSSFLIEIELIILFVKRIIKSLIIYIWAIKTLRSVIKLYSFVTFMIRHDCACICKYKICPKVVKQIVHLYFASRQKLQNILLKCWEMVGLSTLFTVID